MNPQNLAWIDTTDRPYGADRRANTWNITTAAGTFRVEYAASAYHLRLNGDWLGMYATRAEVEKAINELTPDVDGTRFCLACGQVFDTTALLDAHQNETGHEKDAETAQQSPATAEANMRARVSTRSTEQLCYDLALTEGMPVTDPAVPMVRGWLMDELEQRDTDAFDAWVFSDETLPHRFFGVTPAQLV